VLEHIFFVTSSLIAASREAILQSRAAIERLDKIRSERGPDLDPVNERDRFTSPGMAVENSRRRAAQRRKGSGNVG